MLFGFVFLLLRFGFGCFDCYRLMFVFWCGSLVCFVFVFVFCLDCARFGGVVSAFEFGFGCISIYLSLVLVGVLGVCFCF